MVYHRDRPDVPPGTEDSAIPSTSHVPTLERCLKAGPPLSPGARHANDTYLSATVYISFDVTRCAHGSVRCAWFPRGLANWPSAKSSSPAIFRGDLVLRMHTSVTVSGRYIFRPKTLETARQFHSSIHRSVERSVGHFRGYVGRDYGNEPWWQHS